MKPLSWISKISGLSLSILSTALTIQGCGDDAQSTGKQAQLNPPPLSGLYEVKGITCTEDGFTLQDAIITRYDSLLRGARFAGHPPVLDFTSAGALTMLDVIDTLPLLDANIDCLITRDVNIVFHGTTNLEVSALVSGGVRGTGNDCTSDILNDATAAFSSTVLNRIKQFHTRGSDIVLDHFESTNLCTNGTVFSDKGALLIRKQ